MQQPAGTVVSTATNNIVDIAQQVLQRVLLQQQGVGGDGSFQIPALSQEQHHMAMTAPRPTADSLLTPLHEPRALRFRPPPHASNVQGLAALQVDPSAAAKKLEAVLASLLPAEKIHAASGVLRDVSFSNSAQHSLQGIIERLTGGGGNADNGGAGSGALLEGSNGAFVSPTRQSPAMSLPQHLQAALVEMLGEHFKKVAGS